VVASTSVETSQFDVTTLMAGGDQQVSQFDNLTIFNFPSEFVEASQYDVVLAEASPSAPMSVSQMDVILILRGRRDNPRVRTWTFTLDGHDFYVLRLGNDETLVYDTLSEQWYNWGTGNEKWWRAESGVNWIGGNAFANQYGSNIAVGDDTNGALYFLDPNSDVDDSPSDGPLSPQVFKRQISGQVIMKGYASVPCYGVELLGSIGELSDSDNVTVTLESSDDRGLTYNNHGSIDIVNAEYDLRYNWRSLGSMTVPGRVFRITDYGALRRIDSLTWQDQR